MGGRDYLFNEAGDQWEARTGSHPAGSQSNNDEHSWRQGRAQRGLERTLEPGLNTNIESRDTLSVISVIVN